MASGEVEGEGERCRGVCWVECRVVEVVMLEGVCEGMAVGGFRSQGIGVALGDLRVG